VYSILLEV